MVTTLLHGWVWFHASIRVETGGADEYDEKRRQAYANTFIHGARTVVRGATNNNDSHMNQWGNQLKERRGFNKPTVVVVNKNARIIWSMLRNET